MRRAQVFHELKDPLFEDAALDLREFLDLEPTRFETGLAPKPEGAQAKL
jgi:hypothetical protein